MTNFHKSLRRIFTIIIGLVFFVSGFFKILDPVGAKLVVTEYFKFFGTDFLDFMSMPLATFLALLETLTGVALVTGVFRKIAAIISCALMLFFTIITFILMVANPEMDCGCFGEAIHLTHFQTFLKNVVLAAMSVFAFLPLRDYGVPQKKKYVSFGLLTAFVIAMLGYSMINIPITDFTPFKLSSRLAAAEDLGENSEDRYISTFVYEKNGQEGTFSLDNLPDSTWTFVRTETVLRQDNLAEIENPALSFSDANGEYFDHLAATGVVMLVSIYAPEDMDEKKWRGVMTFAQNAKEQGFTTLILTTGTGESLDSCIPATLGEELRSELLSMTYFADYKTLISLNRSNAGVSYFNEGHLIERWPYRSKPDDGELYGIKKHDSTDLMLSVSTKGRLLLQASFLYSFALMLLI